MALAEEHHVEVLRQAKIDLAAALRAAALYGFNEGIDNHFSCAVPGRDDLFLLNRYGPHWSELCASDILTVDCDGNVVDGDGEWEMTAFMIHRGAHRARPDARCVLHTHMPYATALSSTEDGFDTDAQPELDVASTAARSRAGLRRAARRRPTRAIAHRRARSTTT